MNKKIWAGIAMVVLLITGCMTPEERAAWEARRAEQRREAMRQARIKDNNAGYDIKGNVQEVLAIAEAIMRENGFQTKAIRFTRGPGLAMSVTGKKVKHQDLGKSVGMNLLGGALGANTDTLIAKHEDEVVVWVWQKWNTTLDGPEKGRVILAIAGNSYDVNQGGKKVNEQSQTQAQIEGFKNGIVARIQ